MKEDLKDDNSSSSSSMPPSLLINHVQTGKVLADGALRCIETLNVYITNFRNQKIYEIEGKSSTSYSKRRPSSQSNTSISSLFSHLNFKNQMNRYHDAATTSYPTSSRRGSINESQRFNNPYTTPHLIIIFKIDNEVVHQSDATAFNNSCILRDIWCRTLNKNFKLFHIIIAEIPNSSSDSFPLGAISLRKRDIFKYSNEERWYAMRPISLNEYISTQQNRRLGIDGIEKPDKLRDICGSVYLNLSFDHKSKSLIIRVLDYCPFRTREATNSVEQQDLSNTGKPFKFLERSANKQTVLIFSFTIRNSIGEKLTKQQTLKVSSGRKAEPLILDCDFLSTIALSQNIDNCAGVANIKKDSDMTTTPTSTKLTAYTQEPQLHITIKESSHQSTSSLDTSQRGESITDTQSSDLLPTHGSLKILLNQNTLLPKVNGNVGSSTCNNSGVGVSNWYYIKERSPLFQSSALLSPDNLLKGNSQLAHIKMRISLNFDHVLNLSIYQPFQQMLETKLSGDLNGKSALEIILLFQNLSLDQEKLCKSLMKVMLYSGQIREFTRTLAVKYLSQGHDVNTLFRSQTMTTKVIHELMKFVGKSYLKSTLKKLIDIIMKEKKCCEVDPSKLKNKDDLEPNTRNLMLYAELAFTDMVDSCQKCPTLLQEIFSDLKELVLTFYPGRTDVQRLTISSFLVMRFFATAILNPKQYGLVKEQPKDDVNRTLLLVSKILQKVTNSVVSGRSLINKEPWLTPILNRFENESHQNSMIQFLDMISHSSDLTKSEQVDDNIMGILKDGYVVERHNRSERLRTFKRFISTKHRYLVLHPNELCWQKKKDTGESEIKGTLCLEDITDVSTLNSDDNTFKVATSQKEVTFQTKTLIERNDWLIHIQKQQHRQAMKTMSQTDVIEIADIDIERELEIIHTLLYKKIKELKQYDVSCGNVIGIDNKLTAEDHKQILVNNIPEPIIDQLYLDKTNSEWLSNCKSFKGICSDIIQMIEKIEKEHTYTIGKILNSSKVAPDKIKDEFYNDENYLLLASRIKGNAK